MQSELTYLMLDNIVVLRELFRNDSLHTRSDIMARSFIVSTRCRNGERVYIPIGRINTRFFLRRQNRSHNLRLLHRPLHIDTICLFCLRF